ncbi:TatD family hydrolase [Actinomadura coerulea]|uniref:TatD family hydrolase n=1 Tax=Actinomadura coerulea TaxID=46159 RepID=UPI00344588C3
MTAPSAQTAPDTILLDTHCHLTEYDDAINVLRQASEASVHVVAVTEDPGQYRILRTKLGRREGVTCAIGMHPLHAHTFSPAEIARFLRLLPHASWVGEIGLDFSPAGRDTRRQQLRVFDAILTDPHLNSVPVTVHSRGAEQETITRLADAQVTAVLHWYTGPLKFIDDALAANLWFSINPAMVATTKGRALLNRLPRNRVLLETDGPFARHQRRSSQPKDLLWVAGQIAAIWDLPIPQTIAFIQANQERLIAAGKPAMPRRE